MEVNMYSEGYMYIQSQVKKLDNSPIKTSNPLISQNLQKNTIDKTFYSKLSASFIKNSNKKKIEKRSTGYLNNISYLTLFMVLNELLIKNLKIRQNLILKKHNQNVKINQKNISFDKQSVADEVEQIIASFKEESKKLLSTVTAVENDIVVSKTKILSNYLIEEVNKLDSCSPDVISLYILSIRFDEARKIHSDFIFFTKWSNYTKFFDIIEHHKDINIGEAYEIAEKLKDILD
jgi:hypothetical protein